MKFNLKPMIYMVTSCWSLFMRGGGESRGICECDSNMNLLKYLQMVE